MGGCRAPRKITNFFQPRAKPTSSEKMPLQQHLCNSASAKSPLQQQRPQLKSPQMNRRKRQLESPRRLGDPSKRIAPSCMPPQRDGGVINLSDISDSTAGAAAEATTAKANAADAADSRPPPDAPSLPSGAARPSPTAPADQQSKQAAGNGQATSAQAAPNSIHDSSTRKRETSLASAVDGRGGDCCGSPVPKRRCSEELCKGVCDVLSQDVQAC